MALFIHCAALGRFNGGVVILSATSEVRALEVVQRQNYDWNWQGQGFPDADF